MATHPLCTTQLGTQVHVPPLQWGHERIRPESTAGQGGRGDVGPSGWNCKRIQKQQQTFEQNNNFWPERGQKMFPNKILLLLEQKQRGREHGVLGVLIGVLRTCGLPTIGAQISICLLWEPRNKNYPV